MPHSSLPPFVSSEEYESYRMEFSKWLSAACEIAQSHGLSIANSTVFPTGSNLIVGFGNEFIVKIFPEMHRHQYVSERLSLVHLSGRLTIPTPEILFEGEYDGWPYLIITWLKGIAGEKVWPEIEESEKERTLWQIGNLIREVQQVPLGALAGLEPNWQEFLPKQIANCIARHTRLGLPKKYLDGLNEYLNEAAHIIPERSPVLLTGEYIPENLLLDRTADGWSVSGLIDFGDVMTGFSEYDLLGPSVFMGGGKPKRIENLLKGFGFSQSEMTPVLKRRLMTLFLLHRYSEPIRQVHIENWQNKTQSLFELEQLIWPF